MDENNDNTGIPEKVMPIIGQSADKVKLRLEQMIRDNIKPRMKVQMKSIKGWNKNGENNGDGFVILIRIPKSQFSTHMVSYKRSTRFFSRCSSGKFPLLYVDEIKNAFLASESLAEKVRNFRRKRLSIIIANEGPVLLRDSAKIILHIIPLHYFGQESNIDIHEIKDKSKNIQPFRWNLTTSYYNIDGILKSPKVESSPTEDSYVQIFRNGSIEYVDSFILKNGYIPCRKFIKDIIYAFSRSIDFYKALDVLPPIIVLLSLNQVKNIEFIFEDRYNTNRTKASLDRDNIILPDLLIEDLVKSPEELLRPLFDFVWQAGGLPRCDYYHPDGTLTIKL